MGKTGNGKSSTINTIAGKKLFEAKPSQTSVTKECQAARICVHGNQLLVVDTPGLYDTDLELDETLTEIGKVMGITSPGFHAFIIIVKVGRFTPEEKSTIELLAEKFGRREFYKRAVILFTGVDDLEDDGSSFDEYINGQIHDDLKKIISECGKRAVGFNNRAKGEEREIQLKKLMGCLQDIIKSNANTYYTNVYYKAVERMLEKERKRRIREKMETEEQARMEILREIEENRDFGKQYQADVKEQSESWCVIL